MIFRQKEEIRSGTKTQTRRLIKPGEVTNRWYLDGKEDDRINEILAPRKTPTKYGNIYRSAYVLNQVYAAVPKRGQKSFGRIRITTLRVEHLQDITEADAVKEGVASVAEYRELWTSINGKTKGARWDDNPLVVVIDFEYCGDTPN